MNKIKYKIDWTNRSILYTEKEIKSFSNKINQFTPLTQGIYKNKFEKNFKNYLNSKNAYALSNCSNAIDLSAMLIDIQDGDEVIVPSHTWCATAISFAREGAKIVWADIELDTFNISLESIKNNFTKNTKAIIVVHLYGLPSNIIEIKKFAKEKKLILIEDCAQALGASINKKKIGTFGDISVFSFHSNKLITTFGEGGMIVINNKKFDKNIHSLAHNGVSKFNNKNDYWKPAMTKIMKFKKGIFPYNFCLGEPQCFIGNMLIKRIDQLNNIRIDRAKVFISKLKDFDEIIFQKNNAGFKNVYHCLVAYFVGKQGRQKKDMFFKIMSENFKIKVIVQNYPLHRYDLFRHFKPTSSLINTNYFFSRMVSWPFYTYMSQKDFEYMILSTIKTLKMIRRYFDK